MPSGRVFVTGERRGGRLEAICFIAAGAAYDGISEWGSNKYRSAWLRRDDL